MIVLNVVNKFSHEKNHIIPLIVYVLLYHVNGTGT